MKNADKSEIVCEIEIDTGACYLYLFAVNFPTPVSFFVFMDKNIEIMLLWCSKISTASKKYFALWVFVTSSF